MVPTLRRSLLALTLAILVTIPTPSSLTPNAHAAAMVDGGTAPVAGSLAPAVATGHARLLGTYPEDKQLAVTIALAPRNPTGLAAYAASVSDPTSPQYRHYLSPADVQSRFGPDPAAADAIIAYLQAHGIAATSTGSGVVFSAPAGVVGPLFSTSIASYGLADGRTVYSPMTTPALPHALAASVQGVMGLDNQAVVHPAARLASGPGGGFTPTELREAYGLTTAISNGIDGSGETIDLYELSGYNQANITAYDNHYGLTSGSLTPYTCATSGGSWSCTANQNMTPTDSSFETEVEADIEVAQAIAPHAAIHVYETDQYGPQSGQGSLYNLWQSIIDAGDAHIVSTSWGLCELDQDAGAETSLDTLFQEAAAEGIGVYAASGDAGSYDCFPDGTGNDMTLAVDAPANDPNVTSVGGTSLTLSGNDYGSETVWNSANWNGGGGGVSTIFGRPDYQSGLSPTGAGGSGRMVPDVSAQADPGSGYSIYTDGSWTRIGGTSLATPLWAATIALADEKAAQNSVGPLGFANPALYLLGKTPSLADSFHDITSGNNDVEPSPPGSPNYPAGGGYDLASGWGSPNGANLLSDVSQSSNRPTLTPTQTPTNTSTSTPTATPTNTPTDTPTNTPTATPTNTPTDSPAPAVLRTVTALQSATPAVIRGGLGTPTPTPHIPRYVLPPTPPRVSVFAHEKTVRTNGTLHAQVHTLPHVAVTVTLQITTTRQVYVGKGKHRKRVKRTIVLYRVSGHGSTNWHGIYNSSLHVRYKVSHPVAAILIVAVKAGRVHTSHSSKVTIAPPPPPVKHKKK